MPEIRDTYIIEIKAQDTGAKQAADQLASAFAQLEAQLKAATEAQRGLGDETRETADEAQQAGEVAQDGAEKTESAWVKAAAALSVVSAAYGAVTGAAQSALAIVEDAATGSSRRAIDDYGKAVDGLKATFGGLIDQGGVLRAFYLNKTRAVKDAEQALKDNRDTIIEAQKAVAFFILDGLEAAIGPLRTLTREVAQGALELRVFAQVSVALVAKGLEILIGVVNSLTTELVTYTRTIVQAATLAAEALGQDQLGRRLRDAERGLASFGAGTEQTLTRIQTAIGLFGDEIAADAAASFAAIPEQVAAVDGVLARAETEARSRLARIRADIASGAGDVGGTGGARIQEDLRLLQIKRDLASAQADGRDADIRALEIARLRVGAEQEAARSSEARALLLLQIADEETRLLIQRAEAEDRAAALADRNRALDLDALRLKGEALDATLQADALAQAAIQARQIELDLERALLTVTDERVATELRLNAAREQALIFQRAEAAQAQATAKAEQERAAALLNAYRQTTRAQSQGAAAATQAASAIISGERELAGVKAAIEAAQAIAQGAAYAASGFTNAAAAIASAQHAIAAASFAAVAGGAGGGAAGASGAAGAGGAGNSTPSTAATRDPEQERRDGARAIAEAIADAQRVRDDRAITINLYQPTLLSEATEVQRQLADQLAPELRRVITEERR